MPHVTVNHADVVALERPTIATHPVLLVGAGPGDPGLLTLHAFNAINQAEVILLDALVADPIRALIPAHIDVIEVGKRCGKHSMDQRQIERIMVAKARAGAKVVRLKGGDAMMFGRVGEEMLALQEAGLNYQVVPGVTAASGLSAYGAMPMTHREVAQGVTLITGHGKQGRVEDWRPFVIADHTLVIYMGVKQAASIQQGLLAAGMNPQIPVAIVAQASQIEQQRVVGTLTQLTELAQTPDLPSPAAIIVGEVVKFHQQLDWFSADQAQLASFGAKVAKLAM
ncbi:uroporphyrinogen-III C-methyltransferase [uncultured Ferrimonas sp.]|uniref:uroporphyrinogen-III C-methyltransferase n=1 Tax=uncultured Ferrimonas sp. TaxID=432640 RepID=UPI00263775C5|nr:uroporphyrinogen-III C-methyltransferase [uncultured Ferrimonas sp.]